VWLGDDFGEIDEANVDADLEAGETGVKEGD